jgi:RNA polymerase sigma-70 factor (ECF subfamily)
MRQGLEDVSLSRRLVPRPRMTEGSACADWSDTALVAAVVGKSQDAYDELYRRHHASVAAVSRMILVDGAGCEEVVDDVFVDVWLSPEVFDATRGSVLSFLRLKARCRSIDVLRSERSRTKREERDSFAERVIVAEVDAAVLAAERADELRDAVASLPAGEREAIHLAFFDGMSYRAVATHLDLAEGTVKSRIRKGLRRLSLSGSVLVYRDGRRPETPPFPTFAHQGESRELSQR